MTQQDWPAKEFEILMMRVTALEKAVTAAGITIPPTPAELLEQAQADARKMSDAAGRGE